MKTPLSQISRQQTLTFRTHKLLNVVCTVHQQSTTNHISTTSASATFPFHLTGGLLLHSNALPTLSATMSVIVSIKKIICMCKRTFLKETRILFKLFGFHNCCFYHSTVVTNNKTRTAFDRAHTSARMNSIGFVSHC